MGAYLGSKATSGLCQAIIALMPPHDTHIETHLGGGAIRKRKPPALHNIGVDLNARALARFQRDYQGRELIYCNPPYLQHTRTSGRR
jgi:DNA adenine methylase